jgi:hypothetical protein
VKAAISTAAQNVFEAQGMSTVEARAAAGRFIFGSADVAAGQVGSLSSSLWGEASSSFTRSLSGDIAIIGTVQQANPFKIFAQVEIPALLENPNVTSAGGVAMSDLKATGVKAFDAMLGEFTNVAKTGLYASADGAVAALSKQALESLGFSGAAAATGEELAAQGLSKVVLSTGLVDAAGLLGLAGAGALKLLGGLPGQAILTLLLDSTEANAGEDKILQHMQDNSDVPKGPSTGSVTQNNDGTTTIKLPFDSVGPNGNNLTLIIAGTTNPLASSDVKLEIDGVLQLQAQVLADGNSLLKFYNTAAAANNTKPYREADVATDPNGKVTNVTIFDATQTAASVAQIFGSALGRALVKDNNQLGQAAVGILAGTVAGALGTRLAQAFAAPGGFAANGSLLFDANIGDILSADKLVPAGAGSIASLLTAELGTQLGLTGFGGQMFNAAVGGYSGSILATVTKPGGVKPATTSPARSVLISRMNSRRRRPTPARSAGNCSARSAARWASAP